MLLVPTRELALQTAQVCKELGKHLSAEIMVTTGGTSLKDDIMRLYQPTHIVVATPGRILDLSQKGVCKLNACRVLVMDEVRGQEGCCDEERVFGVLFVCLGCVCCVFEGVVCLFVWFRPFFGCVLFVCVSRSFGSVECALPAGVYSGTVLRCSTHTHTRQHNARSPQKHAPQNNPKPNPQTQSLQNQRPPPP